MNDRLRILLLDTLSCNVNHYIMLSIAKALRRHPRVERVIEAGYGDALALAHEHDANFFLAFDGQGLKPDICRRLRERCGFAALWLTDDPYELRANRRSAALFDIVFTNDSAAAAEYRGKGRFLPLAADAETHYFPVRAEKDPMLRYDVFFAGVAWPNRVRLLHSLVRDLPDVIFKIALVGNEHLAALPLAFASSAHQFRMAPRDFASLANASRVTLGLHRDFATSAGGRTSTASPPPRLFEAGIAGTLQLVAEEIGEVRDYFEPGNEIETFGDYGDCLRAIRAALSTPERRYGKAVAAQRRVLAAHLYDHRVAELLERCAAVPAVSTSDAVASDKTRRPRVLMVTHNVVGANQHGGVELYVDHLRRWLAPSFDVFTYSYARNDRYDNTFVLIDPHGAEIERVEFDGKWQRFSLSNAAKERHFATLLLRHEFDLVHYQHLIGHPLSLPIVARALGLPALWTLHDFDAVCDSFNLIDYRTRFCEIDQKSERVCEACTQRRVGLPAGTQTARRGVLRSALSAVDKIVVNGATTRTLHERFFPEAINDERVIVLPVPLLAVPESAKSEAALRFSDGANVPLTVAVFGNFTAEKGAEVVIAAAQLLARERVVFRLHGQIEHRFAVRLAELALPNVDVRGPYQAADIAGILRTVDCTLHASIWPETYCISLSEAWAHGRVPIVSDIGALGARVTDSVTGLKVAPDDPADLVRLLRELLAAPGMIENLERTITPELWPDAADHTATLCSLYKSLIEGRRFQQRTATTVHDADITLFDCGIALSPYAHELSRGHDDAHGVVSMRPPRPDTNDSLRESERGENAPPLDGEYPLVGYIDLIDERVALELKELVRACDQTLTIQGWCIDRRHGATLKAIRVLLVGTSSLDAYANESVPELRPDVGDAFGSEAFARAGFRCTFDLKAIPPGRYRIALEDDGRVSQTVGPAIVVHESIATESTFAAKRRGDGPSVRIEDINGQPVADALEIVVREDELSCTLEVEASERATELWLMFESARDGARRYAPLPAAERGELEDATLRHRISNIAGIPAGPYYLTVAMMSGDVLRDSPARILIKIART